MIKSRILLLACIVFSYSRLCAQGFWEMFEPERLGEIHLSVSANAGSFSNKYLTDYIESYNQVNKNSLSGEFKPFRFMTGAEVGARWTIMEMHVGRYSGFSQDQSISPFSSRVMDLQINYIDALGSFPIAKGKFMFSLGLQTIRSIFSLYLKYNNGYTSFGKESNLSGNYKGLGINSLMRFQGNLLKTDKYYLGIYGQRTGVIAGTGGIWTDNNAAKGALNLSNSVTSTDIKTEFKGWVLGVNFNYIIGK